PGLSCPCMGIVKKINRKKKTENCFIRLLIKNNQITKYNKCSIFRDAAFIIHNANEKSKPFLEANQKLWLRAQNGSCGPRRKRVCCVTSRSDKALPVPYRPDHIHSRSYLLFLCLLQL